MAKNPIVQKLRERGTKTVTIKDEELGESVWTIRPLSTFELAENADLFEGVPTTPDPTKLDEKTLQKGNSIVLKMMKSFLPLCTVSPRITVNSDDPALKDPEADVVHLNTVPINIASQLFNEILKISGLSKEADEARKN